MGYYTEDELQALASLDQQLHQAKAHSPESIRLGRQRNAIGEQAIIRNRPIRKPVWMQAFEKKWGL